MDRLMKFCGIYKLYYKGSDKFYIGSTSRSFANRLNVHLCELRKGRHHNQPLQRAYLKYGEDNIVMEPLIICDKECMLDMEEFAIRCLKPSYNASKSGATRRGVKASEEAIRKMVAYHKGKKLTEEHKKKISEGLLAAKMTVSEEHKKKLSALMTNRVVLDSTKDKLRKANLGKKQSKETIEKRSKSMSRAVNLNKYTFINDNGTEVFDTVYYMINNYGLDSHIYNVINGKRSSTKGWRLKK